MLKDTLRYWGITQNEIKEAIGIKSSSTINLKLNGKARITVREAMAIRDYIYKKTNKKYKLEDLLN